MRQRSDLSKPIFPTALLAVVLLVYNKGLAEPSQTQACGSVAQSCPQGSYGTPPASPVENYNFLKAPGSDPTGLLDQGLALSNAMSTAKASKRKLYIPMGHFRLTNENIKLPINLPMEFGDVTFTTNGHYIEGTGDFTPFIGATITSAWMRRTNYPGNDWGTFTNLDIAPTGAIADYEKGAAYFFTSTSDASTYRANIPILTFDAVGIQSTGSILFGNMTGRAWGGTIACSVATGSNGLCTGLEIDSINNSGTDNSAVSTRTTKVGVTSVALGDTPSTDAFAVLYGTNKWHNGLDIFGNAVIDYAWDLRSSTNANVIAADLDPRGNLYAQSITSQGKIMAGAVIATSLSAQGGGLTVAGESALVGKVTVGPQLEGNQLQETGGLARLDPAVLTTQAGPLSVAASGSNETHIGSSTSPVEVQGVAVFQGIATMQAGVILPQTTIARLPPCSGKVNVGLLEVVTDAVAPTFHGSLSGGGASFSGAVCSGSSGWIAF